MQRQQVDAARAASYCSRRVDDLAPGAACPDCGHTSVIHPMFGNPGVTHCALCEVEDLVLTLRGLA